MKRRSQPTDNFRKSFLLVVLLLCLTGLAAIYFGVLNRTQLVRIEIPHQLPMEFGKSRQFTAIGHYSDNTSREISNTVTWLSSDTEVAAVSNAAGTRGLIHGRKAGQTTITATDPRTGMVGTTLLKVMGSQLVSLLISPSEPTVTLGQKQQVTALGTFSDGKSKDITQSVVWESSAPSIAFLEDPAGSPGLIQSAAAGSTIIKARDSKTGVSGSTSLNVTEAKLTAFTVSPTQPTVALGTDINLQAIGTFSDETEHDITAGLLWASNNQAVVQIDESDTMKGKVHTQSVGSAIVTATDPDTGLTGSATVVVKKAHIVSIDILKTNLSIPLGNSKQFMARCRFTDGSSHVLKSSLEWAAAEPSIAAFSREAGRKGLLLTHATGSTKITARDPQTGQIGSARVTILAPKVVSYVISPRFPSLALGKTQQLTVYGVFTDQSKKDLTQSAVWSVADPAIAKISNQAGKKGLITSLAKGTTTMQARDEQTGIQATTTLIVTAPELVSLEISPHHATIPLGQSQQMKSTGTFSDGSQSDLTQAVGWMSSNLSVAMAGNVSGHKGLISSKTTGVSVITVKDPATGIKGTARVSVSGKELVSLKIEGSEPRLPLGVTRTLTVQGLFSDGSNNDITENGTWKSSAPSCIRVSDELGKKGKIKTRKLGKAAITFTDAIAGLQKSISLTVVQPRLNAIRIQPKSPSIYLGELIQFKAVGEYTDGTEKDITGQVEWESSNPTLAPVRNNKDRKGLATAIAVGSSVITAVDRQTNIKGHTRFIGRVSW